MDSFEKEARGAGFRLVAGVDEAGRGPLAGPVVAAAVIFETPPVGLGIRDSKALSASRRESLVLEIYNTAVAVGVGVVWPGEIDRVNIHNASLRAMSGAVRVLDPEPDFLLVDGRFGIDSELSQRAVVSGDSLSVSIAAASIIAKTTRDNIMRAYHVLYGEYGFSANKGYPTAGHCCALRKAGPSPVHRTTFRGVVSG